MVGKAQKSHGARSELNSVFCLEKWIGGTPLEHPPYSPVPAGKVAGAWSWPLTSI